MTLIVASPVTGVGNRLQSIGSLLRIARRTDSEFALAWPLLPGGCSCYFQDLFHEPLSQLSLTRNVWPAGARQLILQGREARDVLGPRDLEQQTHIVAAAAHLFRWQPEGGPAEDRFDVLPEVGAILREFRLNPFVAEQVSAVEAKQELPARVGVHVRRGDVPAARRVPASKYFEVIDQDHAEAPLFVVSDDEGVLERFRGRYGERVLTYEARTRERSSRWANQDAFIELLLLSKTRHILAGFSSFSLMAATLGDVRRTLLVPD